MLIYNMGINFIYMFVFQEIFRAFDIKECETDYMYC